MRRGGIPFDQLQKTNNYNNKKRVPVQDANGTGDGF